MNGAVGRARQAAQVLVRLEFLILSAVYLYFVVADVVPFFALALIALIWVAKSWTMRKLFPFTPLDLPIVLILLWLPISLWVSTNWWLSLPKITGVVLGVLFYYATAASVRTPDDAKWAAFWLAIVFTAIALAGLVGTDWAQGKILSLSSVYDRLPHFIQGIPRSIAGGFARNGVGGTLTLTIPFLAAVLLQYTNDVKSRPPVTENRPRTTDRRPIGPAGHLSSFFSHTCTAERTPFVRRALQCKCLSSLIFRWSSAGRRWSLVVVSIALVLSLVTLALTQSRGAILGTGVGLLAVAVWRERRAAWILVVAALALALVIGMGQWNNLAEFMLRMDAKSGTLASRLEVWQRGIWMVQDFPFTGIGIGTYNDIAHGLYPFFIAAPDEVVAHAHNNLLEVAVDLGIPGALAFVALLIGFVACAVRAYRATTDPDTRALLAGLLFAMLAHQVFGLTDAFILGTKPGVLIWIFFGLAVAIYQRGRQWNETERQKVGGE